MTTIRQHRQKLRDFKAAIEPCTDIEISLEETALNEDAEPYLSSLVAIKEPNCEDTEIIVHWEERPQVTVTAWLHMLGYKVFVRLHGEGRTIEQAVRSMNPQMVGITRDYALYGLEETANENWHGTALVRYYGYDQKWSIPVAGKTPEEIVRWLIEIYEEGRR